MDQYRNPTLDKAAGMERTERAHCQLCERRAAGIVGYECGEGYSPLSCVEVGGFRRERVVELVRRPPRREVLRLKTGG